MTGQDLAAAFKDTWRLCSSPPLAEATRRAAASSRVYRERFHTDRPRGGRRGSVSVVGAGSFEAARQFLRPGRTAVLNFANPVTPGGGVLLGAMAQEECLCRSSNLYPCLRTDALREDFYQVHLQGKSSLYSDRLIYTQGVTVFKDDRDLPRLLPRENWFQVDVITCAAPYLAGRGPRPQGDALQALFRSRIQNIFEAALDNGAEVLILGAFGCGAFGNPPEIVSAAFRELIREEGYARDFDRFVFAIKGGARDGVSGLSRNFTVFQSAFAERTPETK